MLDGTETDEPINTQPKETLNTNETQTHPNLDNPRRTNRIRGLCSWRKFGSSRVVGQLKSTHIIKAVQPSILQAPVQMSRVAGHFRENIELTFTGSGIDTEGGFNTAVFSACTNTTTNLVFDLKATDTYVENR